VIQAPQDVRSAVHPVDRYAPVAGLALLAVLAVMTAHVVYKLVRLPFRLVRGLFRHKGSPVQLTAR